MLQEEQDQQIVTEPASCLVKFIQTSDDSTYSTTETGICTLFISPRNQFKLKFRLASAPN